MDQQARFDKIAAENNFKLETSAIFHEEELAKVREKCDLERKELANAREEYALRQRERQETLDLLELRIASAKMRVQHVTQMPPPIPRRPDTPRPKVGEEVDGFMIT